ncbi:class I SAM-dependent methyltransferase [Halanaerobium praevalens]|uniref:rRNA methylase n=1 Tax=Halanaerobium praevalens (strain ATCC 33744 / DSM 2228 / GSL) TaxID=572479 RepID=E3DS27_HALPG|nr:class I SAM-dependent methyltransferase [Halanaerobium praevalens]ADO77151.1 rRNA methylase [Halanaerobium praevalens DSM 2228]
MKNKDFLNAVAYSHILLENNIDEGDLVIDATAGNGYDTKFLAELVKKKGKVYAFDLQAKAIENTNKLLKEHNLLERVELFQTGHQNLDQYLNKKIKAVIFNLGYLPGGDKALITKAESTILALEHSLKLLKKMGIIILVIYSGHLGGEKEKRAIFDFVNNLDSKRYNVLNYRFLNQPGIPPEIVAIKKRK